MWDYDTGNPAGDINMGSNTSLRLTWLKEGHTLLSSNDTMVYVVDVEKKTAVRTQSYNDPRFKAKVGRISVSAHGRFVFHAVQYIIASTGARESRVFIYETNNTVFYSKIKRDVSDIDFSISPNGKLFSITLISKIPSLHYYHPLNLVGTYEVRGIHSLIPISLHEGLLSYDSTPVAFYELFFDGFFVSTYDSTVRLVINARDMAVLEADCVFWIVTDIREKFIYSITRSNSIDKISANTPVSKGFFQAIK